MISIFEMVKTALDQGELGSLLRGERSYGLPRPYMCPTELPTDWDAVLTEGIYEIIKTHPSLITPEIIENVLLDIMTDTKGVYCALNVFWLQIMNERWGGAPFIINRKRLIQVLSRKLIEFKNEFIEDKRWMGSTEKRGLWDEIQRICKIIKKDFAIEIVPIEL